MAIIKCSECNCDVSSNAEKCPKCGNPIKNGLLGKAGSNSRIFNIGCLFIIIIVVAFTILRCAKH